MVTINPETHEPAICGEIAGDLFYEIEDFLEKLWPAKNRVLRESYRIPQIYE
ncbi:hypothetical protein D3C83_268510 [compost metagenome]